MLKIPEFFRNLFFHKEEIIEEPTVCRSIVQHHRSHKKPNLEENNSVVLIFCSSADIAVTSKEFRLETVAGSMQVVNSMYNIRKNVFLKASYNF